MNIAQSTPNPASFIVIADERNQRLAFDDTLREFGFDVVGCYEPTQLFSLNYDSVGDDLVWLIDSPLDDELQKHVYGHCPKEVLIGFGEAPNLNNVQMYRKWQNILLRRLSDSLQLPKFKKAKAPTQKPWKYVVFLGASMGGPDALKVFLDNISPELPIALLLAHHFDTNMIHALPRVLMRHNEWRCQVITTNQSLRTGHCLIAPIDRQIVCDSEGRVLLLDKPWRGEYQPNISAILKNVSDVYGSSLISIIFSGMGNDGSQFLHEILPNRSHLWAQSPESSGCPSQPQAMIDSGFCQFVGSPLELAKRINHMFRGVRYQTSDVAPI